ncbi:hypothetical protein ACQKK5_15540 [Brevibacillus panacihumi]|uniref:hypothetical protein n=1 Tax=Brevibacillus panacihumi TaxID=497735 RepID=UPI003D0330D9
MSKPHNLWLFLCISFLLTACSMQTWSHKYEGNSANWQIVLDVVPDKDVGAIFIGKLDQRSTHQIQHVNYEIELKNGSRGGNLKNPEFDHGPIKIFEAIPNSDTYQQEFKDGLYDADIQQFFTSNPVLTITWTDDQGKSHKEVIELILVESK